MNNFLLSEKGFFIPALLVSASLHAGLIVANGWLPTAPAASVLKAPSSLEVTALCTPVVTVMEEQIVFEEIVEGNAPEEVVFSNRPQEPVKEEPVAATDPSEASRGALTEALPLARVNPAPSYPHVARQRGWEGTVRLEVLVGKDGQPEAVSVRESSGHDVLDRAAAETVEQWRFSPARSGRVRFASRITIPVRFDLIQE